ncbi:MAG TPA: Xaa-Pro peptidase family protein [Bryobacteraceae bacterium]|nr:Xaa-Pro peptidase family protein [Bryobacteraceae bacterium]
MKKLDEAVRLMAEQGLGGLIVYSNGTVNILRASYLQYFAGFALMGPNNAAVVSPTGEVVLVVEPAWDARRAMRRSWIGDVRATNDFPEALRTVIQSLGIDGTVGLVGGSEMPHWVYELLYKQVQVRPADDIIDTIARTKSPEELALARKVAAIADIGFEALHRFSRVGVREYELVAEMEYAMRCAGADDNFILMSSGSHNTALRNPTDRRLTPGDIVIGEITPVCQGQFIQLCRTVVIGEPSPVLVEKYDLLIEAWLAAVGRVKAHEPASIIASTIDGILSGAGYARYCQPPYMRTRGHGFGIGSVAPGATLDRETTSPLLENQVVVVHPNQYLPETGYLACGETYLVGASGAERLSRTETKLYVNEA